ncbi:thiamine phosphate synthase [Aliivibrio kagoshimensis]|uniref:thiamine phosphate synthase n=1 Tax=Aliivibrio kagoshimensis TaxID=2910230 RepID=UPI003D102529
MNALYLSSENHSLLSQIERFIEAAKQKQLDQAVELVIDSTGPTGLLVNGCKSVITFTPFALISDADLLSSTIKIAEAPSDMTVADAQRLVLLYPNLVLVNVQIPDGFLDVWQFDQFHRALFYPDSTNRERHHSLLLTALVFDFPLEDALTLARANVSRETWPTERHMFPTPILPGTELAKKIGWHSEVIFPEHFVAIDSEKLGLYPVVDSVEWIEKLLSLGVTTLQLRIKNPNEPTLEDQIKRSIEFGRQFGAQVFINDYWQLAIKHDAYGVHLGQEDIEVADMVAIANSGLRIGLSTHGYYEILRISQLNPSYIALGHIFPTTTKQMPSKPQGLSRLALYRQLIKQVPTVAIGGIDLNRAPAVWQTGVSSLAVVRAVTEANDPKKVIDQFSSIMHKTEHHSMSEGA